MKTKRNREYREMMERKINSLKLKIGDTKGKVLKKEKNRNRVKINLLRKTT